MSGIFLTMKRIPGGVAFVVAGALAVGGLSACGGGTAGKIRNLANGTTAKRIEKFQQRLETAQKLEYTAEYESKDSSGKTETIRVAQKPPKSLFSSGDTTIINDGTDTFTCTKSGGSSGYGSSIGTIHLPVISHSLGSRSSRFIAVRRFEFRIS